MHGALALWATVLCKQAGQSEIVVGFPYANREHPVLGALIGYFVNTLAARVRVDIKQSFRTTIAAASHAVLGALTDGNIPFTLVVSALRKESLRPSVGPSFLLLTLLTLCFRSIKQW